ncbi:MAG TPA: IS66 family transposase [Hyphomicrobiaceae bacterium]|jgi:transposase|nr:IS66 family transposase [Hyphomicrobiaceae bacterium]
MAPEKIDSLDADSLKPLVQQLLARIDELLAQNNALLARVAELEARLGQPPKTPDNSSLPPSRGQKANAELSTAKPQRKGRPGVARRLAENPDATRRFYAERCRCGAVLDAAGQDLAKEYDHIDIPPIKPVTTRIELFRATCPCCRARVTAGAPADMPEGTPFGPTVTSIVAYLHGCQMVGYKRLTEVCQGLFGLTISQGAIANMLARVGETMAAPAERIAAHVRASEVIASDETSARVKGKTCWQWTFGCATAVSFVIAETRGKCVPTEFLAGTRPKMWLSDRLPAQCKHAEAHQFCLAHLIRDAQYAVDHGDSIFAPGFKALLKDACAVGRKRPDLADATIAAHRRRLEKALQRLLACKPTDAAGRKLRDAVALDCRGKLFVFLKRRDCEPTNNESERALRPSVIFRKVTNGFRSRWGAKAYAALCSIVETGRRNGRSALTAIRHALAPPAAGTAAA